MAQPVSDVGSNAPENIAQAASVIGNSSHRRKVFEAIYTGKRKIKTVSELRVLTNLPHNRVLDAGKRLADHHLVKPTKLNGETAYEKIGFFHSNKKRILRLASSPTKLKAFPTRRNPNLVPRVIKISLLSQRAQVKHLTIDDIDSFGRVRRVKNKVPVLGNALSEAEFKRGMQKILGENGRFKDWGGETSDLFTSQFRVEKRRRPVALALKGPGTKGKLTPGKMGKNGDQIQRLFEAPAEVFLVQYCRQVDSAVPAQMKLLAVARSLLTNARVFYGIIDGTDSKRLVIAYPKAFRRTPGSQR